MPGAAAGRPGGVTIPGGRGLRPYTVNFIGHPSMRILFMKRLTFPLLILAFLALACRFGAPPEPPTVAPPTEVPPGPSSLPPTEAPPTAEPTVTAVPAEPTATPPPASTTLRVVVRLTDGSLQIIDTAFPAGGVRSNQGLLPRGGAAGEAAYVLDFQSPARAQRVDAAGTTDLPFVVDPNYGLAVWPGNGTEGPRLGWATSPTGDAATTQLSSTLGS